MDTVREIPTALIMHCDVISMIFAYYSKLNFSRKKQNNEILYEKLPTHFTLTLH